MESVKSQRSPATELLRNRVSQRRSRQRRRNYLSDIKERLQQYERDGVKASTAVQQAAQQVVVENQLLRTMLRHAGYNTAQVDLFLHQNSFRDGESARKVLRDALETGDASQALPPLEHEGLECFTKRHTTEKSNPQQTWPVHSCTDRNTDQPNCPTQHMDFTPTVPAKSHSDDSAILPERDPCPRDSMMCEDAARIIASIRGQASAEDVWPELGCSLTQRCAVKNVTIMTLAAS